MLWLTLTKSLFFENEFLRTFRPDEVGWSNEHSFGLAQNAILICKVVSADNSHNERNLLVTHLTGLALPSSVGSSWCCAFSRLTKLPIGKTVRQKPSALMKNTKDRGGNQLRKRERLVRIASLNHFCWSARKEIRTKLSRYNYMMKSPETESKGKESLIIMNR